MKVSEHFHSIQGEGRYTGLPAVFLRLSQCNLTCGGLNTVRTGALDSGATWRCDTIEVWLKGKDYSNKDLLDEFDQEGYLNAFRWGAHLVITGGEPLLHQDAIVSFLEALRDRLGALPVIEIESNATLAPTDALLQFPIHWNLSPKLCNSGMPASRRIIADVIELFKSQPRHIFKFVVSHLADVQEVHFDFVEPFLLFPEHVFLMPGADTLDSLARLSPEVRAFATKYGYSFSPRLHVSLWNKRTGV